MYSTMNHEMVHVATPTSRRPRTGAGAASFSARWPPQSAPPESLLYSYLTVPRFTVPRWYLEGSAVFMETWMAGGLGRGAGRLRRDGVSGHGARRRAFLRPARARLARHRASTSRSAPTPICTAAAFFTWLAYAHSPAKVVAWLRRDDGSRRHYADQFEQVFGLPLDAAWQDWIAFEHEFQRRNLAEVRKHAITPQRNLAATALGSVSRGLLRRRQRLALRRRALSRHARPPGRARHANRHGARARRHPGRDAVFGDLAGVRRDATGRRSSRPTTSACAT
jgi:hypothetical protein